MNQDRRHGRACPGHPRLLETSKAWMPGTRPGMTKRRETTHETRRPHRKAARHQAREGLELETYLRKDRRLFRSADRRRDPWPDEADQTAGRQCRRIVRAFQVRGRDAERDADARHADAADRSPDLP